MRASGSLPRLAVTPGEPAGIGADLIADLAASDLAADLVVLAAPALLIERSRSLGRELQLVPYDRSVSITARAPHSVRCLALPLRNAVRAGQLDVANSAYVLDTLERASYGCLHGEFDALLTGPVHKGVIADSGVAFSGHTEFLAERADCAVVMLLASANLRVALATTHLPLKDVPAAISKSGLTTTLRILEHDLRTRFALSRPRIAVLGLNPHAGEGGHLGREEIDVIAPALEALRAAGLDLIGPLPADTAFTPAQLERCDAVLAMYHDQGLPVLKYQGFGAAVNITLGLPYVRTSVDHGTALDLAGSGRADAASLIAAARMALTLIEQSRLPRAGEG